MVAVVYVHPCLATIIIFERSQLNVLYDLRTNASDTYSKMTTAE